METPAIATEAGPAKWRQVAAQLRAILLDLHRCFLRAAPAFPRNLPRATNVGRLRIIRLGILCKQKRSNEKRDEHNGVQSFDHLGLRRLVFLICIHAGSLLVGKESVKLA